MVIDPSMTIKEVIASVIKELQDSNASLLKYAEYMISLEHRISRLERMLNEQKLDQRCC